LALWKSRGQRRAGVPESRTVLANAQSGSVLGVGDQLGEGESELEAKSEQTTEGMLSMDYVRKTNTQLASVAGDRGVDTPPDGSISVVVSPHSVVDPDAVPIALSHVHLASPKIVLDIAHDTVRAWKELRGIAQAVTEDALHPEAARVIWEHRALPTQVRERLSKDPIRGI